MSVSLQDMGYAPDFVQVAMAPFIKDVKDKGKNSWKDVYNGL